MKDARMVLMSFFTETKKTIQASALAGELMRMKTFSSDEFVTSGEKYDFKNHIVELVFPSGVVEYIRYRKYSDAEVPAKWFFDWKHNVSVVTDDLAEYADDEASTAEVARFTEVEEVAEVAEFVPASNTTTDEYKPLTEIEQFIVKNCKIKKTGITKSLVVTSLFAYQVKSLGQKDIANGVDSVETLVIVNGKQIRYMRPTDGPKFDKETFDFCDVIFSDVIKDEEQATNSVKEKEIIEEIPTKEEVAEESLAPYDEVTEHNIGEYEQDSVTDYIQEETEEFEPVVDEVGEVDEIDEVEKVTSPSFPEFSPSGEVDYEALGRYVAENCIRNDKGLFVDKAVISPFDIKKDEAVNAIIAHSRILEAAVVIAREEIEKEIIKWKEYCDGIEKPCGGNITLRSYDGVSKVTNTPTKKDGDGDTIRVYSKINESGTLNQIKLAL